MMTIWEASWTRQCMAWILGLYIVSLTELG